MMNRINEELLDFESPNFNIFKLEKKVGRDNILPVIATYIFSTLGLFSIIDYVKFEPFIFRVEADIIEIIHIIQIYMLLIFVKVY